MEAEHVAQDEYGALARREVLQTRHERERDGLLGLVARRGTRRRIGNPLEQRVRVRLEPRDLGEALRRMANRRRGRHFHRPAAAVTQRVQAPVGRDRVEPGAQRRPALELLEPAPGGEQCLLQQVLGVLERAEDPVAVQLQLAPVGRRQLGKRLLVTALGAGETVATFELIGHAFHLSIPTPPAQKTHR